MFGSAAKEAQKQIASLESKNQELAALNTNLANELTELRSQFEELSAAEREKEVSMVNDEIEALKTEFATTLGEADAKIKALEKELSTLRFEKETVSEEAEKLRNSEANLSGRSMVDMLSGFNSMLLQATTAVADTKQAARDKMVDVVSDFSQKWQVAHTDLAGYYMELENVRNKAEYSIVAFVKEAQRIFKEIDKRTSDFRVELSDVSAYCENVESDLLNTIDQLSEGAPKALKSGEEAAVPQEEEPKESPIDEYLSQAETPESPVEPALAEEEVPAETEEQPVELPVEEEPAEPVIDPEIFTEAAADQSAEETAESAEEIVEDIAEAVDETFSEVIEDVQDTVEIVSDSAEEAVESIADEVPDFDFEFTAPDDTPFEPDIRDGFTF